MVQPKERESLRALATRWMAHAADPIMVERRRQWRAVKDLRMEKPVILLETCMLPDYIVPDELVCEDPYLRNIEKSLLEIVRHADEIGDDIVVDPYFRIPWEIQVGLRAAHRSSSCDQHRWPRPGLLVRFQPQDPGRCGQAAPAREPAEPVVESPAA